MIRVLVVEDSPSARDFLLQILGADPAIVVVGTAGTGEEAIQMVRQTRPDIITMDVHMPRMNGFDATRRIMETYPTPIVIVSGAGDSAETGAAFRAIECGAIAALSKPAGVGHPDYEQTTTDLLRTVKAMSEVKVVRRWPRRPCDAAAPPLPCEVVIPPARTQVKIVAVGASTGGPPTLQTILAGLGSNFSVPILIVQHIAIGFTRGFVEWLGQSTSLPVLMAAHGEYALPRHVYVAPDAVHMKVGANGRIQLKADEPENGLRPSVACLFRSVAKSYGPGAVGVLLTGMGKDGAAELKLMKDQGAVTIAQDEETSIVHGMPGEAIRLGGATYVLSPEQICGALNSLTSQSGGDEKRPVAGRQNVTSEVDGPLHGLDVSRSQA